VGPEPRLTHALVAGISVLIIACPCAMGLATPVSVLVGSGRGAELGILFRKGDALQSLAGVRTVAFDKTGTLTEGHPSLAAIHPVGAWTADELLRLAASAETGSEHPLARALVTAAADRGIGLAQTEGGRALAGQGYAAKVAGHAILLGNRAALERDGISAGNLADTAAEGAGQGLTPIFLAIDGQLAGLFVVADRVRPTSAAAIGALRQKGLATAMISGDAEATARTVARGLGIETVIAGVLPDGKVEALARLPGRPVAFVGDGLNDGPALAAADVGIAMGGGTDLAREAADVVIMRNDLALVASAIALSRATLSNIRQNLFWAFGYNVVLIPVAAGALYPVNGLMLSPLLASAAMALSSVFVVTNALRLRRFSRPGG
jgi:Cu+-exporting ATPase